MKTLVLGTLLAMACTSALADQQIAGYDRLTVSAPHRTSAVAASVWYPIKTPTYRNVIGDNAVFKGTSAYVGAAIKEGKHPLIVLSHGSGGNMDGLSWLSSGLALKGAMVLAVNHPGSTSGDSSPRRSLRLDERAKDLMAALDELVNDPAFADYIDESRISSLGFSLGGATALNLAGLRFKGDQYNEYCNGIGKGQADCVFLSKGGVDFSRLPAGFSKEARDSRVTAAIAVDPGFTYVIDEQSLMEVKQPVLLLNIGEENLWKAADVGPEGSNLVAKLENASFAVVKPGHHFTFLAECKPEGAAVLAAENDDPVCDDPEGTDRAQIHEDILEEIARFLKL
ncbi:Alpha/beta hydrolase family protein [Pseudovibrio sp. Ad5]|uniref:alpha/beta hydrolase family protein n=1 Tax=Pseudovibrio sp. Ad5 TaxID=989436 RepID=UPI0007AED108|nr:alpha/beta fold hydrolase [Pseudovibrio sp. Ad5]KZK91093.1 Alpha/beta hydrolase family protein [Pseudovibrio sp. Ad5]